METTSDKRDSAGRPLSVATFEEDKQNKEMSSHVCKILALRWILCFTSNVSLHQADTHEVEEGLDGHPTQCTDT